MAGLFYCSRPGVEVSPGGGESLAVMLKNGLKICYISKDYLIYVKYLFIKSKKQSKMLRVYRQITIFVPVFVRILFHRLVV